MARLVYVADDEPGMTALLEEALCDAGYEVVTTADGQQLLDKVEERVPDLVLLDINMPGISGWEVRRRLAQREETANVPVIAVTAQGGASIEESAIRTLDFTDLLRKPFRLADLLDRVERALPKENV